MNFRHNSLIVGPCVPLSCRQQDRSPHATESSIPTPAMGLFDRQLPVLAKGTLKALVRVRASLAHEHLTARGCNLV